MQRIYEVKFQLLDNFFMTTHEHHDISLDLIDEPAEAMRTDISRDAVFELGADIMRNGLISPITVRPRGSRYEVVAGHRRFLAHRYCGIPKIKCIVRELTDREVFSVMTSENLKRENVPPVDEALHVARAMIVHNGDIEAVAKDCSKSRAWVESRIAIGAMPADIKESLQAEKIKLGVSLALAEITDDTDRAAVLQMAISQGASVVMAQYWLAQWNAGLFGHASNVAIPDASHLDGIRNVVMLRCNIDGEEHPASEMHSVLIHQSNLGYVDALRASIKNDNAKIIPAPMQV